LLSKIAILIDAENISYRVLPQIFEEIPRHGEVVLCAVFGDWDSPALQKWHEIAEENEFIIRHQKNNPQINNAADTKLIMDAMDVLHYRRQINTFCLVTNDADYVPLCDKVVQEEKKRVIVVGCRHNAAEALIRSCTLFIPVECRSASQPKQAPIQSHVSIPVEEPSMIQNQQPSPKTNNQPKVRKLLKKAFAKVEQDTNGWVSLSALGAALHQVNADFQTDHYGHTNLSQLVQSIPDFVEFQADGNNNSARLKSDNSPKRPNPNNLQKLLTKAFFNAEQDSSGWVTLSSLGTALSQAQTGFKTKHYGHANLSKLLQKMPSLVELRANGSVKSARLKSNAAKHQNRGNLQKNMVKAFSNAPQEADGWVTLSALGTALRQVQPGFKSNNYGHSTLTKLLQSMPDLVTLRTKSKVKSALLKKW
jgi:Ca2+-binding EF-hand superfamily protein